MRFWKMNGAGNDFIVINNIEEKIPEEELGGLAKILCERHTSVGADGFMAVEKAKGDADYRMLFYNSDGSMREMCGNGARCICRYGYETGLAGSTQTVQTTAGIVTGHRVAERLYRIRLNDPANLRLNVPIEVGGRTYECAYVELGNPGIPHAVVPFPGLREFPEKELLEIGRSIRYSREFPKGANVNFYEITGEDEVFERTYERGVEDFTYACGTGTGSVVTVLTLTGKVSGQSVAVDMTGGRLTVDAEREGEVIKNLFLTGPAMIACKGEIAEFIETEDKNDLRQYYCKR